ncbi:MAG: CheR family methyltransferase [Burkholderiaceae bacterium]
MSKPRESVRKTRERPRASQADIAVRELSPDHAEVELAPLIDDAIPTRGYQMLPMVGLGGSAGCIPALQAFFHAMPPEPGLVFVVILHLSAEYESMLAELLQRSTAMRVEQVNRTIEVEANHVYVIPPGKQIASANGRLELVDLPSERGKRVAVDLFFRTLADTHGAHAAAIVLSGADGDGAIGVKRIKERGGLTIAQDPREAQHESMPSASIRTGMVDWVLPVADIPERLISYYERARRLELPPEDGAHPATPSRRSSLAQDEAALRDILIYLHTRSGRDFSYYKRATILRRIGRRLQVNAIDDLKSYLVFLRTNESEPAALLQDLLISVTNFFRDREAFDALALRLPSLFRGKGPGESVRVWVPGCATGEEAYSLAIMLHEYARNLDAPPQIQIFATDLDEAVIKMARDGVYPDAITADVSEDRLRRWFTKELHGYRVRREIRELVAFALHDLLKDSPFSRLDLVSCRNLLIYLNREAQSRAFEVFHFALRPHGCLFLGMSESVDNDTSLFSVVDKKYRIYAQQPTKRTALPVPVGTSALARALELRQRSEERPALPKSNGNATVPGGADVQVALFGAAQSTPGELHYKLIERFASPSMLVDTNTTSFTYPTARAASCNWAGVNPRVICCSWCTRRCASICAPRCSVHCSRNSRLTRFSCAR